MPPLHWLARPHSMAASEKLGFLHGSSDLQVCVACLPELQLFPGSRGEEYEMEACIVVDIFEKQPAIEAHTLPPASGISDSNNGR